MDPEFETIREKIIRILEESSTPLSASEIASLLGLDPSDRKLVYEALSHIAKTIRRKSSGSKHLVMIPPHCKKCGYVFKDLDKPRKPSKCPRCKSERIEEPRFAIIEK